MSKICQLKIIFTPFNCNINTNIAILGNIIKYFDPRAALP